MAGRRRGRHREAARQRGDRLSAGAPEAPSSGRGRSLTPVLETSRLLLRPLEEADRDAFVAIFTKPETMQFPLGRAQTPEEAGAAFERLVAHMAERGFGKRAVLERSSGRLIGYCGVGQSFFDLARADEVEVGWRFDPDSWGRGYATEAALAALREAFDELGAPRALCYIAPENVASTAVADRLGFRTFGMVEVQGSPGWPAEQIHLSTLRPRDLARRTVAAAPSSPARQRTLDLLDGPDSAEVLDRDDGGHVTGSAIVVDPSRSKVLVLWHKKLGLWVQPGGHLDGDWDLGRSALREATEETGIEGLRLVLDRFGEPRPVDVDVHTVAPPDAVAHDHHDVRFAVLAPAGAEPVANDEADRFRWLSLDEVDEVCEPSVGRLVRAAVAAIEEESGSR